MKFSKSAYPPNHSANDFSCFGPVAEKDGEFDQACLVDMGCFNQEKVDSNKYVHACVAQSKLTNKWYTYQEWGRTGQSSRQFLFEEHNSKEDAQRALASYAHSKNDRRGVMKKIAGIETLVAKPGKDVYKVQSLSSRTTGLPDAKNITSNAGLKEDKVKKTPSSPKSVKRIDIDPQSSSLLRDLRIGTISYARTSLEGGNIPTQAAIDEARDVLTAALKRLGTVGDDVNDQVKDRQIKQLTYHLYSRIPKKKDRKAAEETWILSRDNYAKWTLDLDAFENAIYANTQIEAPEENPYGDLPLVMESLPLSDGIGKFLFDWISKATANRHHGLNRIAVKNIWKVTRNGDQDLFKQGLERCRIRGDIPRPLFQPTARPDLTSDEVKKFVSTNTTLLFHGTRSVNVAGILRTMLKFSKDLPAGIQINGKLLGDGAYYADDVKKSVGYTSVESSYWSKGDGKIAGRGGFMFLMDCALGTPFLAPEGHPYTKAPAGYNSIFAKGGHTLIRGYGTLQNNEWVIFDRDQINLRYLFEFDVA